MVNLLVYGQIVVRKIARCNAGLVWFGFYSYSLLVTLLYRHSLISWVLELSSRRIYKSRDYFI